jgi:hypothetical protein
MIVIVMSLSPVSGINRCYSCRTKVRVFEAATPAAIGLRLPSRLLARFGRAVDDERARPVLLLLATRRLLDDGDGHGLLSLLG